MTQFKIGDRVRLARPVAMSATAGATATVCGADSEYIQVMWNRDDLCRTQMNGSYGPEMFELVEPPKRSPRVGDVVRVVLEGEVTYVSDYGFDVASENTIPHSGAEHVKSVEIIKPAKPSAADLPVPSVVKADGSVFQKRGHDTWATIGEDYRTRDLDLDIMGWTLLVEQASE